MLKKAIAMVLSGGQGERLSPLTRDRAKPAVPFGGIYRIIDFTLSNCLNSGLYRMFLLTQYKSLSLHRHIHDGWNIFHPDLGGFVELLPAQKRVGNDWYMGTADAVYQNVYSIQREKPDYVVILSGDHIYKMDYAEMVAFHIENGAELTVATIETPIEEGSRFGIMSINEKYQIVDFQEKPKNPQPMPGNSRICLASMGIYVFNAKTLVDLLIEDAKQDTDHDFGKNIIPGMIEQFPVYAFLFRDKNKKSVKYWRDIGTLDAYWEANINLASIDPLFNLYDRDWPIRTCQYQFPPAKFVFDMPEIGRVGHAKSSIISNGCIISGGAIRRSILSPNVRVNSFCEIDECVIMHDVKIGRHSKIRKAIIDKYVDLPENTVIGYDLEEDRKKYTISPGGVVVVAKNTGTDREFIHN